MKWLSKHVPGTARPIVSALALAFLAGALGACSTTGTLPGQGSPSPLAVVVPPPEPAPPAEDLTRPRFTQVGIASWYGRKFQKKRTASGERFHMHDLTCAHRSLPLGTVVRVTDLDTGKTVRVRVNDRGPFVRNRVVDLSRGAAQALGMLEAGVAPVRLQVFAGDQTQDLAEGPAE